jgi:hypothetical protein
LDELTGEVSMGDGDKASSCAAQRRSSLFSSLLLFLVRRSLRSQRVGVLQAYLRDLSSQLDTGETAASSSSEDEEAIAQNFPNLNAYYKPKIHVSTPNPKLCTKRSGFGFQTCIFQKPSQNLHFGVNKKDQGLIFHFHVLILLKSW